jgi:N-acetylglucosamine-6-phosphate deacetylase
VLYCTYRGEQAPRSSSRTLQRRGTRSYLPTSIAPTVELIDSRMSFIRTTPPMNEPQLERFLQEQTHSRNF